MTKRLKELYERESLHKGLLDRFDDYMAHKDDNKAAWRKKVVTKMPLNGSPVVNSFRKINWKKALTGAAIGTVAAGPVGTAIGSFIGSKMKKDDKWI